MSVVNTVDAGNGQNMFGTGTMESPDA